MGTLKGEVALASVLLVDSDKNHKQHFTNILNHLGHNVVYDTNTLYDLVEYCTKYKPDYICIDLFVEATYHRRRFQSSLSSVIEKIKEHKLNLKIIIMTPYDMENTIIEMLKAGADDYLFQPISMNDMKRVF